MTVKKLLTIFLKNELIQNKKLNTAQYIVLITVVAQLFVIVLPSGHLVNSLISKAKLPCLMPVPAIANSNILNIRHNILFMSLRYGFDNFVEKNFHFIVENEDIHVFARKCIP